MARFDWYQGTVRAPVKSLLEGLPACGDGCISWGNVGRGKHGFAFEQVLSDMDGRVAAVWWGGQHEHPHVVASGAAAPVVAGYLREHWPEHGVSRADVCIDYAEEDAYERLQAQAVEVASERGIKVGTAGDHLLTKQGRTCYLGSTKSHTRMRLYDKAAELRAQFANRPEKLCEVPQHLARLEVQVRPQTPQAKAAAARVEPMVLMGSAAWTRELMARVAGLDLEPFEAGKPWRQSDDDRAYASFLAQYGGLLKRIRADLGSWECLGLQIGADLAAREGRSRRH